MTSSPTKTDTAFRTIREVADELSLETHVLRFWEKEFSELKPMQRKGGRRYYRAEDIELLCRIKSLLHEQGYTIKGARSLLKTERSSPSPLPNSSKNSLHGELKQLHQKLLQLRQKISSAI